MTDLSAVVGWLGADATRVYDLEQPRFAGMPVFPSHRPGYFYALYRRHDDTYDPPTSGPRSGASGMLTMMEHSGTHIDALSHQAENLLLYGGVPTSEVQSPAGFKRHGIEEVPPIVARGVLLDLPPVLGVERLRPGGQFTAADLEAAEAAQGVKVQKGDVLMVRLGYGPLWGDAEQYLAAAGAGYDASRWAVERGVVAVGADNMTWDSLNARDPDTGANLPGHLHLLVRNGIYIIENLNLEAMAQARAYVSLFICLPMKLVGATGSPVRPIAIA